MLIISCKRCLYQLYKLFEITIYLTKFVYCDKIKMSFLSVKPNFTFIRISFKMDKTYPKRIIEPCHFIFQILINLKRHEISFV